MRLLNLGCGRQFRTGPEWVNVDFAAPSGDVLTADLRQGIPLPDASFDLVYHSHVLEHFSHQQAPAFLRECYRVLKPGALLRVAVPDLERMARDYLNALERADAGEPKWELNHEWMVIEMFDQTVREQSGGQLAAWLSRDPVPNREFVLERIGGEARNLMEAASSQRRPRPSMLRRAAGRAIRVLLRPSCWREKLARLLLGRRVELLDLGEFRRGGEIHEWMYDRVSLTRLLTEIGFEKIGCRTAATSSLAGWAAFHLDTESDGAVRKPDSLYMEAFRPG